MPSYDIDSADIKQLVHWLRDHTTNPEHAMALLITAFVAMFESYTVPKASRDDIINHAVEAIRSMHTTEEPLN